MHRRAVVLLMLIAMVWQTVALARPGVALDVFADREHAALHWHGDGHHHHGDGSYHLDDSNESVQHVLSDHGSGTAGPLLSSPHRFPAVSRAARQHHAVGRVPHPFVEGPLRPPRTGS